MASPTIDLRPRTAEPTEGEEEAEEQPAAQVTPALVTPRLVREEPFLAWEAPEYVVYKKTTLWYIVFGIVLALLLFTAFLLRSFLTGIVFLLSGILIFLYSERPPRKIAYEIRTSGIRIRNRMYFYRDLSAFNVIERPDGIYVLLRSRRLVMPLIHVPLAETDPNAVRNLLLEYLPEDDQFTEPLADVLAHWLGF